MEPRPPSSIRRPTRGQALLLPLGLAIGLGACGRTEPQGRYAVVQREFSWKPTAHSESPATRATLSSSWSFDVLQPEWNVTAGTGKPIDGALLIDGVGKVAIAGPVGGTVDDELEHWVTLRLATTTAASLQLSRRGGAPREVRLQASGEPETITVALSSLERVITSADAPELALVAVGAPGKPVRIRLERIGLVSDYESSDDAGFMTAHLVRAGVRRQGVALRAPGEVSLTLSAAAGDRLRFALAVLGGEQPVEVVLTEAGGLLPEQRFRCTPGAPWSEHALALAAAPPGGTWTFVFHATAPAISKSVVLIGSPLLLRRTEEGGTQVVLYVEDTLRADHLQTLGYPRPTDPHLQDIAAAGETLTRTWSACNWTRPSVSSLLTGLDPVGHGNVGNEWRVADEILTLPEALARAGCVTASFVTNHHGGSWSGLDQGFDAHGDPAAFGADAVTSTLTSTVIRAPIEAFLEEHKDESFFIYAHSLDPHAPYEADDQSLKELAAAGVAPAAPTGSHDVVQRISGSVVQYDGEIRHNDRELALLDAALATRGLTNDTLLVFVADHGEAFFDHGQWEHRRTLHEEELRVPWVMRWPARLPAGVRLDFPASLVDVAPTMLGLLGIAVPPEWRGRDLSALCLDRNARLPPSPLFTHTLDEPPQAGRVGEVAVIAWPDKLIADLAADGTLTATGLYRLDRDPHEATNLLPEARPDNSRLAALLGILRERLEAGPVTAAGTARAADVSPEIEAWMKAMGYLH